MIQEPFATGDSFIHRLDPRLKVVSSIALSFSIALFHSFSALLVSLAVSLLLVGMARLNGFNVLKRAMVVNGMVLLCWLVLPFTVRGEPLAYAWGVKISGAGVLLSIRLTLKSNAILFTLIALLMTSPLSTLGNAMWGLRFPRKGIALLLLTYRYLFVIEQEYQRLITAARVRCFRPKNNVHTYKTYAYLVGMLLVRASIKGERVYQAMRCRGFNGRFHSLFTFSMTRRDWLFASVISVIIVGVNLLEWTKIISV